MIIINYFRADALPQQCPHWSSITVGLKSILCDPQEVKRTVLLLIFVDKIVWYEVAIKNDFYLYYEEVRDPTKY